MERLTIKKWFEHFRPDEETTTLCVDGYTQIVEHECLPYEKSHFFLVGEAVDKLAAYENAEEQGLLLRLPCRVGDKIYKIWSCGKNGKSIVEFEIKHIDIDFLPEIELSFKKPGGSYRFCKTSDIGKTVFLTKAEAESALEKMKVEEHDTD